MGAARERIGSSENGGAWPGGLHPEPQQERSRPSAGPSVPQWPPESSQLWLFNINYETLSVIVVGYHNFNNSYMYFYF